MSDDPSPKPEPAPAAAAAIIAAAYVVGFVVVVLFPSSIGWLGLNAQQAFDPRYSYRLLTYPLVHGSIIHLVSSGILTSLPLMILSRRLGTAPLMAIAATASVLGGLTFSVGSDGILIGGGLVSWAFAGTVAGTMTHAWRSLKPWEIGYGVLAIAVLAGTVVFGTGGAGWKCSGSLRLWSSR